MGMLLAALSGIDESVSARPVDHAAGLPFPVPQDTGKVTSRADSVGLKGAPGDTTRKALPDSTRKDSLSVGPKSFFSDTTYVVDLDSAARLRQWSYVPRDPHAAAFFSDRTYPLYASPKNAPVKHELVIDSTGDNVTVQDTKDGIPLKVPISMSFHDYLQQRLKYEQQRLLADGARKPKVLEKKNDLGDLMSNFTKISIPVPPNPVFSIFGQNKIDLNISGSVDIKAGFKNIKSDQATVSKLDQSRNEPDFSQEVQVTVNGMIGDKLSVNADWNTQRQFEYENQLKIQYKGYSDEIVQQVDAGNVSLSSGTSFIGSSQALFGVKAQFQIGPLNLTTLASQKKGQIKEVAVSGGSSTTTFEMRAYEYATNHYFVDTLYKKYYEPFYATATGTVTDSMGLTQILEAEVWVMNTSATIDPNERNGVAVLDLGPRGSGYADSLHSPTEVTGKVESARFLKLDASSYELESDGYLGIVSFNTSISDQQVVGIAYRTAEGKQYGEFVRNNTDTTSGRKIVLKMLRPKNLIAVGPSYPLAWKMLMKNIYPISGLGKNVKESGFSLDMVYRVSGSDDQNSVLNTPLLQIFGLDKYTGDNAQSGNPDGQFDFLSGRTINQSRAEIIFPTLEPFRSGFVSYFKAKGTTISDTSSLLYPEVYDTTETFAEQSIHNRYVITGKATGEATSQFSIGYNVVEGSVQVLLDGQALTLNSDYTVDYIIGQVVIKNARALVSGANLQIKYEQNDLFQLASKTLLGARGTMDFGKSTSIGFTIMNLNQQSLSDKVRLGEEPTNNTIMGVDFSIHDVDLPFLTRALDALPLLQTKEMSSLTLKGEAAYMIPDANTSKSPIPNDKGESVAYLDDFEGSRRTIPVGISYSSWSAAGPFAGNYWFPNTADTVKMYSKGKMIWFNRLPTDVKLTDIYPQKMVGSNPANNLATVLDFRYFPTTRGMYNYSTDIENTLTSTKNWSGAMKTLSAAAVNLLKENVGFIELWMRVDKCPADKSGKLIIDLGAISERVIPGGVNAKTASSTTPNSEDLVLSSSPNGTLQDGEDIGIDMLSDAQERARYAALLAKYPNDAALQGDPSGDDYYYNNATVGTASEDFSHINGPEGDKSSAAGLVPETEDLNSNGSCDLANSYFEYEVPLDTSTATNPLIVGGGNKSWYQYRIPIRDTSRSVGTPTYENIEYIRVGFVNATDTVYVRIAAFDLVGNQWQKVTSNINDTSFSVGVASIEENPSTYTIPPGVIRERDKTQTTDNVQANEQSLAIFLRGIADGKKAEAVRYYSKAQDLFSYKTLKMFVHGDERLWYVDETNYDAEMYFRFGSDSLNFYEYREPIRPGWDELNNMVITFSQITALKQGRDSTNTLTDPVAVNGGPPGATYRVLGKPSLTQVTYLCIGVENPKGKGTSKPLTADVWFDELRLVSVDNSRGWAYKFDTQVKLADFGSVAASYQKVDPNFHSLESQFGSRTTSTTWALSTSFELAKLLPASWQGTSMPVSYSHSESFKQPKYLPSSDVLVSEAAMRAWQKVVEQGGTDAEGKAAADELTYETQTKQLTDTWAAPSLRLALPAHAWYVRDLINKLGLGFTYTKSKDRSPTVAYHTSWSWNATLRYQVAFPVDYYLQPFRKLLSGVWVLDEYKDMKIYYAPVSFSWSFSTTRSRDVSLQRTSGSSQATSRNFSASRQMGLTWKFAEGGPFNFADDYSLNVESSLLSMEVDDYGSQRSFSKILNDIFFGSKFINFGQDTRASQRNSFTTKPTILNPLGLKKYADLQFGYSVDYSWSDALSGSDLGKSSGVNNSITLTLNIKLKSMFDPLFKDGVVGQDNAGQGPVRGGRGRRGDAAQTTDSTAVKDSVQAGVPTGAKIKPGMWVQLKNLMRIFVKIPFLDYDNVSLTFNETNNIANSGIVGRTGFVNFWGRIPFFQEAIPRYGPSRLYQLGLISDPNGTLTNFRTTSKFPFFAWDVTDGVRAANGRLVNTYRQSNRLTLKTNRNLWEGARLDLTWNVTWSYYRSQSIKTDSLGNPTLLSQTTTGSVDRSFFTLPDFMMFSMFKSSLKEVSKKYAELKSASSDTSDDAEKLSQAFEQGFEALPLMRKIFGQFYPRVNWSFHWEGLEKLSMFKSFVTNLSLDHSYTSNFTRQYQNLPLSAGEQTTGQQVAYGFSPLVGLNFKFKEIAKGAVGATVRYSTGTTYSYTSSSSNIVEALTQEISVSGSYTRHGFEIPFFGLSLSNDIDISTAYSLSKSTRTTYAVSKLDTDVTGTPMEGSTRTTIEPRIKYTLSSRVNASVYYRLTKVVPNSSGSTIPGTTTNEAGLDVHISIQ